MAPDPVFENARKSRLSPKIATMSVSRSRAVLWTVAGILALISGYGWLSYFTNGLAYGDVLGLKGREKDIAMFGAKSIRSLFVAVAAEGFAVGAITWDIAGIDAPKWPRLAKTLAVTVLAIVLTLVVVNEM
jgi:hypothetical protein